MRSEKRKNRKRKIILITILVIILILLAVGFVFLNVNWNRITLLKNMTSAYSSLASENYYVRYDHYIKEEDKYDKIRLIYHTADYAVEYISDADIDAKGMYAWYDLSTNNAVVYVSSDLYYYEDEIKYSVSDIVPEFITGSVGIIDSAQFGFGLSDLTEDELDETDCFVFTYGDYKYYVAKDTYIVLKCEGDTEVLNVEIEYDVITDEDVAQPDLSTYTNIDDAEAAANALTEEIQYDENGNVKETTEEGESGEEGADTEGETAEGESATATDENTATQ